MADDTRYIERMLSDQSTASLEEKLMRFLRKLADQHGHNNLFFDDGMPRMTLFNEADRFVRLIEAGRLQVTAGVSETTDGAQQARNRGGHAR